MTQLPPKPPDVGRCWVAAGCHLLQWGHQCFCQGRLGSATINYSLGALWGKTQGLRICDSQLNGIPMYPHLSFAETHRMMSIYCPFRLAKWLQSFKLKLPRFDHKHWTRMTHFQHLAIDLQAFGDWLLHCSNDLLHKGQQFEQCIYVCQILLFIFYIP